MKRFLMVLSLCLCLCLNSPAAFAGPPWLSEYSGLFPADRAPDQSVSNYLLVDGPKKLSFHLLDAAGTPLPSVRVTEVVLTSDPAVGQKSPDGLKMVDLGTSGIYEVKVTTTEPAGKEIGFQLKVGDEGAGTPAATPAPGPAPAPVVGSAADAPPVLNLPPVGIAPPTLASPAALPSTGLIPAAAASPSAAALPAATPAVTVVASAPAAAPDPIVPPATVTIPVPSAAGVAPVSPVPADVTVTAELVSPAGPGYANPYQPVEVRFQPDLPAGTRLEDLVQVFHLDAAGRERPVPGTVLAAGPGLARFLATSLVRGAVFHVRALHPATRQPLASFRFQTLPEILVKTRISPEGLGIDLSWSENKDLLPSAEGQVVQLDGVEIIVHGPSGRLAAFPVTAGLPPFGNQDGVSFQGQPFRLSLLIPPGRIQGKENPVAVSLQARITQIPQPLEVLRVTLASPDGPAAPIATVPPGPATGTDPLADVAAVDAATPTTAPATPVPATPPALVAPPPAPPPEPIVLKPVVPIADPGPRATLQKVGSFRVAEGSATDYMAWPKGLTWAPDGSLWVTDSQNRRILQFTEEGRLMQAFGKKGKGPGQLGLPIDLAIAGQQVFVSDTAAHTVAVFSVDGTPLRTIGTWGTRPGQTDLPHGLCVASGQLILADRGNCRIMRFGLDGTYRGGFGTRGELPGSLRNPIAVEATAAELFVIEDRGRLQRFSYDGKYLGQVGAGAKEPAGLEIDPWGYLWIPDPGANRVMRIDARGTSLLALESAETAKPWIPTAVAVRSDGLVAIGDGEGKLIRLFRLTAP
ncbi:MAG: hypothetical protein GX442_04235 [Candidatus Riflebacteria bacterium]|nr:hypothetical protein [Candidatus Riflebacteria bacterium]